MHLGLIGAGNISATHLRAAQSLPGVEVVAVYSPRIEKARALATIANARAYDDLKTFLAQANGDRRDRQAVGRARGAGDRGGRRGLHVLVEKPLDISSARIDTDRGGGTGRRASRRLLPGSPQTGHRAREELMEAGPLGEPVMVSGRVKWHRPPEYYAAIAVARHVGARWRRRADEPGDPHGRRAAVDFRPGVSVSAPAATRLHEIEVEDTARRCSSSERRARRLRGGDVGLPRLSAARRAHRLGRNLIRAGHAGRDDLRSGPRCRRASAGRPASARLSLTTLRTRGSSKTSSPLSETNARRVRRAGRTEECRDRRSDLRSLRERTTGDDRS